MLSCQSSRLCRGLYPSLFLQAVSSSCLGTVSFNPHRPWWMGTKMLFVLNALEWWVNVTSALCSFPRLLLELQLEFVAECAAGDMKLGCFSWRTLGRYAALYMCYCRFWSGQIKCSFRLRTLWTKIISYTVKTLALVWKMQHLMKLWSQIFYQGNKIS